MEYLFLRRKKTTATSEKQKALLYRAADRWWEEAFVAKGINGRKVDCNIYKGILYQLEIRRVFLDTSLSLKNFSELLETNQTYLSNVVNRYFGCNLKELVNTYRIEYAKELLRAGHCLSENLPKQSGFASKSAFYSAFGKITGMNPSQYLISEKRKNMKMIKSN